MLACMSSRQFSEWIAFYSLEAEEQERAHLDAQALAGMHKKRGV